jgi:4-hydroxybenzoate polyprenyltransferase
MIKNYLQLMRVHQYSKNLFLYMPLFFGLKITDAFLFMKTTVAALSFCLVSSSVYILNDLYDREDDRKHPEKKERPIASGRVETGSALILMVLLMSGGLSLSLLVNIKVLYLLLVYIFINAAYTLVLKHLVLLDVLIISAGFIIRLSAGSVAAGVKLSSWIVVMTFLLALFLSLAKRRYDLIIYLDSGNKVRRVIDGYNLEFLNAAMMIMASVVIVSYLMYTSSPAVIKKTGSHNLYLTVFWVITGILRYMQITFIENNSGSPTIILLRDRFIQLIILGWLITFGIIIYR